MQDLNSVTPRSDSPAKEDARITASIHLLLWEERLVAAYSGDQRLEAALEYGTDFYERISDLCFRKPVQALTEEERELGCVLARAGNLGLGKRYISGRSSVSPVRAQELLNQYYAVFHTVQKWHKQFGREACQDAVQSRIEAFVSDSLIRCVRKLPVGWEYKDDLSFLVPPYIYEKNAEKFFRHFFEREMEFSSRLVRLPVEIMFRPFGAG